MRRFRIELLPDDILRLLLVQWLNWYSPKQICCFDSAFCNSSVRAWFLEFVRNRGIPLTYCKYETSSVANRYDEVVRWMEARRFPLDRIDIELETAALRFLPSAAGSFSVLGSVRSVSIHSSWSEAAVTPNLLRALLAEASNVTSLDISVGVLHEFIDYIPWDIVLSSRKLSKLSVCLGRDPGPLLTLPRDIQQHPRVTELKFSHIQFEWGEFEALLTVCPNLSSLSLGHVGFLSVPSTDMLRAGQPSVMAFVKQLTVPENPVVAEYLLRRCPNMESVVVTGGTSEWLPLMLQSSAVPRLRSLDVRIAFNKDLDPFDTSRIQAQSNEPFQFTELCGDGRPAVQLIRLLQSAQPAIFSISLNNYSGTCCQRYLGVAEFESLPLTILSAGFDSEFGNTEEWMFMLQLPRLEHLEVSDHSEDSEDGDFIVPDVGDVLGECVQRRHHLGLSPSPRLQRLSLWWMRLYSAAIHIVQLFPHLSTLELSDCRVDTETVTTFIVGLPVLSRLLVYACDDHPMVEYDFRGVDFAGRPRMVVTTNSEVLPTGAVLKSFVVGLGSHLMEITIEGAIADLSAQLDKEFRAQNRHVSFVDV